ncbi:MAG: hypothetical protein ABIT09_02520 [Croceibacterium sp.]
MTMSDQAVQRDMYRSNGYVHVSGLVPPEAAMAFLAQLKFVLIRRELDMDSLRPKVGHRVLRRPASEIYSHDYPPLSALHWGLTPYMATVAGEDLLPTYGYFRLYREGDVCLVHGDRPACEHSLSLTLAYSENAPWDLEVAQTPRAADVMRADPAFAADDPVVAISMAAGDGVMYRGIEHHHGRTSPNPNTWSAHVFCHWVARGGKHADQAFDGQMPPAQVQFY